MRDRILLTAAGLSALVVVLHELAGAPMVLPPLSEAGLPPEVVALHHFSWHAGSVLGLLLAALFFVAARRDGMQVVARVATFAACALGAVAVSLAVTLSDALWGTPAPYVWWAVGALGAIGSRSSFE